VLGMPGTGKTSTIACMVYALVQAGKSVLVTSYTHNAVDHVLIKLIEMQLDFIRLGETDKVHPSLVPYTAKTAMKHLKTVDQLASFYEKTPVVGTTCLGVKQ
jgi:DNA replication ATP-dependent helicase Dna2